jgi:hypothetical protein
MTELSRTTSPLARALTLQKHPPASRDRAEGEEMSDAETSAYLVMAGGAGLDPGGDRWACAAISNVERK